MKPTNCMSKHLCVLVVTYTSVDGEARDEILGPFPNKFGASNYFDLVIKPDIVHGGVVADWKIEPLATPGPVFGSTDNQWMVQFG